jgi:biotin carboxyl carrier protein
MPRMPDYRMSVNGSFLSTMDEIASEKLDLVREDDFSYHLLHNNKSYKVQLLSYDINQKTVRIKVSGKEFDVAIEDSYDILAKELGFANTGNKKIKELKSPMPGLVLETMVKAGDTVEEGAALLILEAMKMENVIKSPTDGVIKAVLVKEKEAIEKSQLLIEFE